MALRALHMGILVMPIIVVFCFVPLLTLAFIFMQSSCKCDNWLNDLPIDDGRTMQLGVKFPLAYTAMSGLKIFENGTEILHIKGGLNICRLLYGWSQDFGWNTTQLHVIISRVVTCI